MKLSRLRPDPFRFVVGVAVLAVLLTVLGGLFSAPALHWAVNRGELSGRIAVAVVVGYGFLTAVRLFDASDDRDETADSEQSGLGLLGQLLLVVGLYSGTLAFAVLVLSTVGSATGLHADTLVFASLFYPWWEEATVADPLPAPLPVSFSGVTAWVVAAATFGWHVLHRLSEQGEQHSDGSGSNVRPGVRRVLTSRQWPAELLDVDQLLG